MNKPLDGIKVLDLSTFVAGPATGRLLADMGADVIKIERPEGDNWRVTGVSLVPTRFSVQENPVFDIYNTGKRMISINMKTPEGQMIFHKLLAWSDVFLTNNRDNALKRLNATYDELKDKYPRLIYAQITGFGAKGPDADTPAYDVTAFWTRTGFMVDTAIAGENGDYRPIHPPAGGGDTVTAFLLLSQINAALYQREKTGRGQYVEANLYHTGIFTFASMIIPNQKPWGRSGYPRKRVQVGLPGGWYRCQDGEYVFVASMQVDKLIGKLGQAIGDPHFKDDPRFSSMQARIAHKQELYDTLAAGFLKRTADEWVRIGRELDFAVMKCNHCSDVSTDEQAWANDFLEEVEFPSGNKDVVPRSPLHMESIGELKTHPVPPCGGDTESVLEEMGYLKEEIEKFKANGVAKQA